MKKFLTFPIVVPMWAALTWILICVIETIRKVLK